MSNVPRPPVVPLYRFAADAVTLALTRGLLPVQVIPLVAHRAGVSGVLGGTGQFFKHSLDIAVGGTAPSRPVYTVNVLTSGVTELRIHNVTLGQELIITRAFAGGEAVEVNCQTYEVLLDGEAVDFEGQFPLLDPRLGTNTVELRLLAAAAPSANFNVEWTARFQS